MYFTVLVFAALSSPGSWFDIPVATPNKTLQSISETWRSQPFTDKSLSALPSRAQRPALARTLSFLRCKLANLQTPGQEGQSGTAPLACPSRKLRPPLAPLRRPRDCQLTGSCSRETWGSCRRLRGGLARIILCAGPQRPREEETGLHSRHPPPATHASLRSQAPSSPEQHTVTTPYPVVMPLMPEAPWE